MIPSNFGINNTYIMMQQNPNYQFSFLGSNDLSKSEIETIKKFIIEAISQSSDYTDISVNIQEKVTKSFGKPCIVITGERDKYNYCSYSGTLIRTYRTNIGPYKISVVIF